MNTLDGQAINNVITVAVRKEDHPLKVESNIFRAYEIENDGSLFPLYIGRETVEEVKAQVCRHLSHKVVLFAEI